MREAKIFIRSILRRFTGKSRNLVYFASGIDLKTIKKYYSDARFKAFDNIVLVDFHHRVNAIIDDDNITVWNFFCPPQELKAFNNVFRFGTDISDPAGVKGNIICLRADAIDAVDIFRQNNIKFDYFTVLNEGWVHFPAMNNHAFTGYALPIIKDAYYHFAWDAYRKYINRLPFNSIEKIEPGNESYHEVYSKNHTPPRSLFRLSGRTDSNISKTIGKVKVCLVRKSIWEDSSELDRIFISLRSIAFRKDSFWGKIRDRYDKVSFMKKGSITGYQGLLSEADSSDRNRVVGFIPMGFQNSYQPVIDFMEGYDFRNIREIRFYHMDKNDFGDIYKSFKALPRL
ncbi:MAG: hypothetical protein ACM3NR_03235 [Methanosarcina sp.]